MRVCVGFFYCVDAIDAATDAHYFSRRRRPIRLPGYFLWQIIFVEIASAYDVVNARTSHMRPDRGDPVYATDRSEITLF